MNNNNWTIIGLLVTIFIILTLTKTIKFDLALPLILAGIGIINAKMARDVLRMGRKPEGILLIVSSVITLAVAFFYAL